MSDDERITVEFTIREARALLNSAGMAITAIEEALGEEYRARRVELGLPVVPPAVSAVMRLETALMLAGKEA